jgi:hypothetical protein
VGTQPPRLTKDDLVLFAIAIALILAIGATAWIALEVGISSLQQNVGNGG